MSKHTPGPWKAIQYPCDYPYTIMSMAEPPEFVAEILNNSEHADANAFLITAAPAMIWELRRAALRPARMQAIMQENGLALDDLDDPMQKLAFTFYSELVGAASTAEAIIAACEPPAE